MWAICIWGMLCFTLVWCNAHLARLTSTGAKATLAAGIQRCALNTQTRSPWQSQLQRCRQLSYYCQLPWDSKGCEL